MMLVPGGGFWSLWWTCVVVGFAFGEAGRAIVEKLCKAELFGRGRKGFGFVKSLLERTPTLDR